MAEKSTFIKLDRNIIKWRWYQNANTMRVFLHLLITANVADHDFETITVHRGQRIISYGKLGKELKMTSREVRTAIEHLKTTNELTSLSTPQYTIITILNYDRYQSSAYNLTNKRQTDVKRPTNECQQYNNDKEYINNDKEYSAPAEKEISLRNRNF